MSAAAEPIDHLRHQLVNLLKKRDLEYQQTYNSDITGLTRSYGQEITCVHAWACTHIHIYTHHTQSTLTIITNIFNTFYIISLIFNIIMLGVTLNLIKEYRHWGSKMPCKLACIFLHEFLKNMNNFYEIILCFSLNIYIVFILVMTLLCFLTYKI